MIGNSPAVAALPPLHEIVLPDLAPASAPWKSCERSAFLLASPVLLGRNTRGGDLAADRPDEARELARDRGDGDGLELAPAD